VDIDERIEPLVRAALGAAIKQDVDRLDAALTAFPDDAARRKGLELAVAISGFALFDMYGGKPWAKQVREAASAIAQLAQWLGVTADEANAYFTSLVEGAPLESALDAEAAVPVIFVITATLLAASPRVGQDEWWFNYLDRIEAQLEAAAP